MTLADRLTTLVAAIGADVKALYQRGVPTGGTTGQVLTKTSSNNFSATWADPQGGSGGGGLTTGQVDALTRNNFGIF